MRTNNLVKLVLSVFIANGIRLLRIIPNNDPIMSMALPFSRRGSAWISFIFPLLTMASFDFVTGYVGVWTAITALTYGFIGIAFHFYLKDRKDVNIRTYMGCGIAGVLAFDFVTGVVATPLIYGGTLEQSFFGQIPFTITHLLTSSFFILIVTPLLDKNILLNKRLDDNRIWSYISSLTLG
ncbi:MAG: hypothetical protein KGH72_01165 [Candidatus Micrarchaeota archaeon]|nr:hypothetical protein [Candidatus Micrarchaeota archaeon]